MEFYVIPPLSQLDLINSGERVFVLAQLWLKDENYRKFILDQKTQGKWITLDNGVGDHDFISQEDLLKVVQDLMPNEVIALDVLYNSEATIYNLERFIDMMRANDLLDKVQIFGAPQGNTKIDWLDCYTHMVSHPDVSTIGLSKIALPHIYKTGTNDVGIMEARHACYEELKRAELIIKPIHCLGAGDPREFLKYINDPLMRSTDSCFSIWAAMNGIDWHEGDFTRVRTPRDYFDREISQEQIKLAERNIDFLKKVLNATGLKNN
jgi:hypothetical protein